MEDLAYCVRHLAEERFGAKKARETASSLEGDERALFEAYRALVNVREPMPAADEFLAAQDRMLQARIAEMGIVDARTLPRTPLDGRLSLWRGDITALAADVIVNAANSQMLGCWVPGHHCIDNAIHTYAGIQLRAECARIMQTQGRPEPSGLAKMTGAYNLPAKWVAHTVGPIADGNPDDEDRALLASCYESCLDAARETGGGKHRVLLHRDRRVRIPSKRSCGNRGPHGARMAGRERVGHPRGVQRLPGIGREDLP